ncbi:MAG: hypothetical protein ACFFAI_03440 [Promethearchaeota archaeon]
MKVNLLMIDSDEMKRKRSFLMNLKMIKKVWEHKIYNYQDEVKALSYDITMNQDFFNEETFLKMIRKLESQLLFYRNKLNQEEKTPGIFERSRNNLLKLYGYNPADWERLKYSGLFMIEAPSLSKEECEKKVADLEIGIEKSFEKRERLRAEELKLEKLKRRYNKLINKIRKLDDFLDEEYKKLRQERNENLISLFK